jgi:hypothetical protein
MEWPNEKVPVLTSSSTPVEFVSPSLQSLSPHVVSALLYIIIDTAIAAGYIIFFAHVLWIGNKGYNNQLLSQLIRFLTQNSRRPAFIW